LEATQSRWEPCQEAGTRNRTSPLKPYTAECR
jgi:hypothetical protein